MVQHNGVIVTPIFSFGVEAESGIVSGNGSVVYYVSGTRLVGYDTESNEMSLLPLGENIVAVTSLEISGNRRYLACVEVLDGGQPDQVSVFNLQTEKCVQTLRLKEGVCAATRVVSLAFSEDSKLLLMQCGEPDWECLCWRWYSNKVLTRLALHSETLRADFHPHYPDRKTAVALTARGFKFLHLDTVQSQMSLADSVDDMESRCFCWLAGGMLAIVDCANKIHIYQGDQRKDSFPCDSLIEDEVVTKITEYKKGLLASGNKGSLIFFYPIDSWNASNHLYCPYRTVRARSGICAFAVSSTEELITVLMDSHQLGVLNLECIRHTEEASPHQKSRLFDSEDAFALCCGSFIRESFIDLDFCTASCCIGGVTAASLFVLWSYDTKACLMTYQLPQETYCLSLHVSGHQVLFGMRDKLRLYTILLRRLVLSQEYPVKRAQVAKISSNGHLIATVCRSNTIHLYEVHKEQKEPWRVLKGHVSAITDLCWSDHDQTLISVGAGGACYTWSVASGQRLASKEYVDKECVYNGVIPGPEGTCLVHTSTGRIQWLKDGRVGAAFERGHDSDHAPFVLTYEWEILLYGSQSGELVSRPLSRYSSGDAEEMDVFPLHHREVTLLRLSPDNAFVVTCDVNGIIVLSKLQHVTDGVLTECSHRARDSAQHHVLLSMDDVKGWETREAELKAQALAEKKNAEYLILKQTQSLMEAVKALREENEGLRSENSRKARSLTELRTNEENKRRQALTEQANEHQVELEKLETVYRKRLEVEVKKLQKLSHSKDDAVFSMEEKIVQATQKNEQTVQQLRHKHQLKLTHEQQRCEAMAAEKQEAEKETEEMVRQLELDGDAHIETMQTKLMEGQQLTKEAERLFKMEKNIMARGILKLKSEKVEDARNLRRLQKDVAESQEKLREQTEGAKKLRNEVEERDSVISSNYQTIQELRREVQELEKHKYVLGYQAEKYKEEIQPKSDRIAKLETELKFVDKRRAQSVDVVCELKTRLKDKTQHAAALQQEVSTLRTQQRTSDVNKDSKDSIEQAGEMLMVVEQRNAKLEKRIDSKEKAFKAKLRQRTTENRLLLEEISDLKQQKNEIYTQLQLLRVVGASPTGQRPSSAALPRGTATVQRCSVTRPGSMRQYEWGVVDSQPRTRSANRRRRPFSASTPL